MIKIMYRAYCHIKMILFAPKTYWRWMTDKQYHIDWDIEPYEGHFTEFKRKIGL